MAKVRIEAFVLPAFNTPFGDHTYVEIDGQPFGCHGRSSGGALLTSGIGDGDLGRCLAQPSGNAGIQYVITGVCHQAANRILYAAGLSVAAAKASPASIFLYGAFGKNHGKRYSPTLNPWPQLNVCAAVGGTGTVGAPSTAGGVVAND